MTVPSYLAAGGRALYKAIDEAHELDAVQRVQLLEACRAKDRLDRLDRILRGDVKTWTQIAKGRDGETLEIRVDAALNQANTTANLMKQLLAALRLPDPQSGKRPAFNGGPKGAIAPQVPTGGAAKLSVVERARLSSAG